MKISSKDIQTSAKASFIFLGEMNAASMQRAS